MRRWLTRIVALLVLAGLGLWAWHKFFPDPQTAVRRRLAEVAQLASFGSKESEAAKLWNAQKLASFFTEDVTVKIDVQNLQRSVSGRDEIAGAALEARKNLSSLAVRFSEVQVTVAADGQSAIADLTANAAANGEADFVIQELALRLKKYGRNWLITRIETVKTLR
jgi:ketosteroid isomerase-like protein